MDCQRAFFWIQQIGLFEKLQKNYGRALATINSTQYSYTKQADPEACLSEKSGEKSPESKVAWGMFNSTTGS